MNKKIKYFWNNKYFLGSPIFISIENLVFRIFKSLLKVDVLSLIKNNIENRRMKNDFKTQFSQKLLVVEVKL